IRVVTGVIEKLPVPVAPPDLESVFGELPSSAQLAPAFRQLPDKSKVQRLEFASENGIPISAFLVQPETAALKGVIVGVDDRGKEELVRDQFIQSAIKAGWAVCGVDLRGIGELANERMKWVACVSLLM